MAIFHSISLATAVLFFASNSAVSATLLAPAQDIVLPSTDSASDPLTLLGANSPYFAGIFPFSFKIQVRTGQYLMIVRPQHQWYQQ
jgi:hypothetical protein